MSTLQRRTLDQNRNPLILNKFRLILDMFPGTDFMCQDVSGIGGVTMPVTLIDTIYKTIPSNPGGGLEFDDLNIVFLVSEDLRNYYSIHKWLMINGNSGQRRVGPNPDPANSVFAPGEQDRASGVEEFSNGRLYLLDSSNRNTFRIDLTDIFPYRLSGLNLSNTGEDSGYLVANAIFKYTTIKFNSYIDPESRNNRLAIPGPISEDDTYDRSESTTTGYPRESVGPKRFDLDPLDLPATDLPNIVRQSNVISDGLNRLRPNGL